MKRSTYPAKPQKHAKTSLSEVSTDHEVTNKHCQTDVIRKEDFCGVLMELSDLCKPDQFFGMNLRMNWSVWCIHEGSWDNLPGSCRETARNISLLVYLKGYCIPQKVVIKINGGVV